MNTFTIKSDFKAKEKVKEPNLWPKWPKNKNNFQQPIDEVGFGV